MTIAGHHSSARRKWLCIAYSFPPINRSGTHRTLSFVRHLAARGWDATVLTVEPNGEPIDEHLLSLVPSSVDVVRTPCPDMVERVKQLVGFGRQKKGNAPNRTAATCRVPTIEGNSRPKHGIRDWTSRLLQTPDSRLGWYGPACRAGRQLLRSRDFDVIYSTSPCMTAHLIARRLSRSFGVPWVADFRDPWGDNPFREIPYRSLATWDAILERRVLRDANHVICNTTTMRDRLCSRLPFVTEKSSVIMNGFDSERLQGADPTRPFSSDEFIITHAGQFYGRRSPVPLFRALRLVLKERSATDRPIRLVLIGPDHFDGERLAELAQQEQVSEFVSCLGSKSHRETLSLLAGSDALMVMGSTGPGSDLQVPNKLFEYLALQRPILAAVPAANPSTEVLRAADADCIVCPPDDSRSLAEAMQRLATRNRSLPQNAWSGVERFNRTYRAMELAEVFDKIAAHSINRGIVLQATRSRSSVGRAIGAANPADSVTA